VESKAKFESPKAGSLEGANQQKKVTVLFGTQTGNVECFAQVNLKYFLQTLIYVSSNGSKCRSISLRYFLIFIFSLRVFIFFFISFFQSLNLLNFDSERFVSLYLFSSIIASVDI